MIRHLARAVAAAAFGVLAVAGARAETESPRHGGSLEIGTVYVTLSALSWDPADFNWKLNHDAGLVYEQLFAGDLSKSVRNGGRHRFVSDAWLPSDAIRGELAESWEWKNDPPRVEIQLRQGVMWPDKPGVMARRELVADDIVHSYNRLDRSPKKQPFYFEHVAKVEATGRHAVVFTFKDYYAEWDQRFGWGYYSAIQPREVVEAGPASWRNVTGTGPYRLVDHVPGNSNVYVRNDGYWGSEAIGGKTHRLPFVERITYRTIKDEATQISSLRTGKLDILETIRWQNVESLKKSAPQLKWNRWLAMSGTFLAMRVDIDGPFKDVRVRRALNMAVNKEEIVKAYYDGNAELFGYPMHPDYEGYFEPLEKMPDSVKELFRYDPAKAKKLLAEAGYPKGFSFKVQVCSCNADHMDLLPLVAAYLEQVGVKIEIQPMEYGAFLSAMSTRTMTAGYFMNSGHTSPTTTIRKSFVSKQLWNPAGWADPAFDARMEEVYRTRDEAKRQELLRAMTRDILDHAPNLWLPSPYIYTAWWPWVKNYGGELRAGAVRPGPIYARIWVDQDLKKKMGF